MLALINFQLRKLHSVVVTCEKLNAMSFEKKNRRERNGWMGRSLFQINSKQHSLMIRATWPPLSKDMCQVKVKQLRDFLTVTHQTMRGPVLAVLSFNCFVVGT